VTAEQLARATPPDTWFWDDDANCYIDENGQERFNEFWLSPKAIEEAKRSTPAQITGEMEPLSVKSLEKGCEIIREAWLKGVAEDGVKG
jgi:hypothetical protein